MMPMARVAGPKDRPTEEDAIAHATPAPDAPQQHTTRTHVVLLGDSVLDNFYWLDNPRDDLQSQLQRRLRRRPGDERALVTNLSVDESVIDDVLRGQRSRHIRATYVRAREGLGMDPYLVDDEGYSRPLQQLRDIQQGRGVATGCHAPALQPGEALPPATHVFLSVGGNDARAAFAQSFSLDKIVQTLEKRGFVSSLTSLLTAVRSLGVTPTMVFPYHPQSVMLAAAYGLPPMPVVTRLMKAMAPAVLGGARAEGVSVVDLARTFNPYNAGDYGSTVIEPSNRSSDFIAQLMIVAMEGSEVGATPRVFSCPGGGGGGRELVDLAAVASVQDVPLDEAFLCQYPELLDEHLKMCPTKWFPHWLGNGGGCVVL